MDFGPFVRLNRNRVSYIKYNHVVYVSREGANLNNSFFLCKEGKYSYRNILYYTGRRYGPRGAFLLYPPNYLNAYIVQVVGEKFVPLISFIILENTRDKITPYLCEKSYWNIIFQSTYGSFFYMKHNVQLFLYVYEI